GGFRPPGTERQRRVVAPDAQRWRKLTLPLGLRDQRMLRECHLSALVWEHDAVRGRDILVGVANISLSQVIEASLRAYQRDALQRASRSRAARVLRWPSSAEGLRWGGGGGGGGGGGNNGGGGAGGATATPGGWTVPHRRRASYQVGSAAGATDGGGSGGGGPLRWGSGRFRGSAKPATAGGGNTTGANGASGIAGDDSNSPGSKG
ncbi:unnamed protein product, partial [Phaeothamnion confervicola]